MQKEITDGPEDRKYIEKSKNKKQNSDPEKGKKARRKRKLDKLAQDPEEREAMKTGDFIIREAKRARKQKKIRTSQSQSQTNHRIS